MQFDLLFLLYAVACLCIGSTVSAISWRWHKRATFFWKQEARAFLDLTVSKPSDDMPPPSFLNGRSQCINCHNNLRARDLIPLISYALSKGKCRLCKEPISKRYPAIELVALLSLSPLYFLNLTPLEWTFTAALISCLLVSLIIDYEHQWLPDELNALVTVLAFALLYISHENTNAHIIAGLIGFSLIAGLRFVFLILRKVEAIGLGDAKLLAALAFWLGPMALSPILLGASVTGILFSVMTRKPLGTRIPFGPFLIVSSFVLFYIREFT